MGAPQKQVGSYLGTVGGRGVWTAVASRVVGKARQGKTRQDKVEEKVASGGC